jgi:hypothetical protein
MVEVQRQLGLRNIEVPITNPAKKNINHHLVNNNDKVTTEKDNSLKSFQTNCKQLQKIENKYHI